MLKASKIGEATFVTMKTTIKAMTAGTEHEGKINTKYIFCKTHQHSLLVAPGWLSPDDPQFLERSQGEIRVGTWMG
jgi:hypothetical protein